MWKHFPCFMFSLAVSPHFLWSVWWSLLPCLIKLFKYSLPDKAQPLAAIHTRTTDFVGFQTENSRKDIEAHIDTTEWDNKIWCELIFALTISWLFRKLTNLPNLPSYSQKHSPKYEKHLQLYNVNSQMMTPTNTDF